MQFLVEDAFTTPDQQTETCPHCHSVASNLLDVQIFVPKMKEQDHIIEENDESSSHRESIIVDIKKRKKSSIEIKIHDYHSERSAQKGFPAGWQWR